MATMPTAISCWQSYYTLSDIDHLTIATCSYVHISIVGIHIFNCTCSDAVEHYSWSDPLIVEYASSLWDPNTALNMQELESTQLVFSFSNFQDTVL